MRRAVAILILAACVPLAGEGRAAAQEVWTPIRIASVLGQAQAAASAGKHQEAISLADEVIAQNPRSREAVSIRISSSLALGGLDAALTVYERYAKLVQPEDLLLLGPIARASLAELGANRDDPVSVHALEALALAGDASARAALLKPPKGSRPTPVEVRARLGDATAIPELRQMAAAGPVPTRLTAIQALKDVGRSESDDVLRKALADPDMMVRLAAAETVGHLRIRSAVPELEALLEDRMLMIRIQAAVALRLIGSGAGERVLQQALSSEYPDARLAAARAYLLDPYRLWVAAVRPLLDNQDGLNRFGAAELLLGIPEERPAVAEVLIKGVTDTNLNVRAQAVRILAADPKTDPGLLRVSLRDGAPWPRIHAARAIVARHAALVSATAKKPPAKAQPAKPIKKH